MPCNYNMDGKPTFVSENRHLLVRFTARIWDDIIGTFHTIPKNETHVLNGSLAAVKSLRNKADTREQSKPNQVPTSTIVGVGLGSGVLVLIVLLSLIYVFVKKRNSCDRIHVPCDHWEIVSIQVELIEELGKGAFATVWKASMERKVVDETTKPVKEARQNKDNQAILLNNENDLMIVAVKMLHIVSDATLEEKHEFLREIEFMKNVGCHRNIISMVACCTKEEHVFLVVEFAKDGDLLNLLRERRKKIRCPEYEDQELSIEDENVKQHNENLLNDLISISWQIATGMEYLASKGIVHRDLAARNILVAEDNLVKVADFGLSRHVTYKDQIYQAEGRRKLPIKWMSPEAILDQTFTTKSDVWSYGVALWEIFSMGGSPYPTITNSQLVQLLRRGHRMDKPYLCPDDM
ncbi:hypothetical protein QZH41_014917 [Actinostola sp. cb2023]|nr:hypothetical protein QZH41_014917 [Actinostola sp. cb2023]